MLSMVLGQGTSPTGRPGLCTHRWLGQAQTWPESLSQGPLEDMAMPTQSSRPCLMP